MKHLTLLLAIAVFGLSSCFSSTFTIGDGPQQGIEETDKNHFVILGLAPVGEAADVQAMAQGKEDYRVNVKQTFVDGLLTFLTFGIYGPRTVTVTH